MAMTSIEREDRTEPIGAHGSAPNGDWNLGEPTAQVTIDEALRSHEPKNVIVDLRAVLSSAPS
jgi:hypothetical protein